MITIGNRDVCKKCGKMRFEHHYNTLCTEHEGQRVEFEIVPAVRKDKSVQAANVRVVRCISVAGGLYRATSPDREAVWS